MLPAPVTQTAVPVPRTDSSGLAADGVRSPTAVTPTVQVSIHNITIVMSSHFNPVVSLDFGVK